MTVPSTAAVLLSKGLDATGLTHGLGDRTLKNADAQQADLSSHMYNPDGYAAGGGRLTGQIAATLPVAELKVLEAAPEASALVRGLAKYGKYGVQGATAGLAVSGGHDMTGNAALGAALGPVGGAIGEHVVAPIVDRVGKPLLNNVGKPLARALRNVVSAAETDAAPVADVAPAAADLEARQTIRRGNAAPPIDTPAFDEWEKTATHKQIADAYNAADPYFNKKTPDGALDIGMVIGGPDTNGVKNYVDAYQRGEGRGTSPADLELQQFAANNASGIEAEFQRRAGGQGPMDAGTGQGTGSSGTSAQAETAGLVSALKNAGAGRGIESVRDLPQSVTDDIAQARASGIPADHAQREAVVRYVGAEPTIGSTTRDPTAQRLEKVHANLDTPEGAALAQRASDNNTALHNSVQKTIEGYGGVPAQGEVSQTVAQSLANASDAEYSKVSALYKQGDEEAAALKGSADADTAQRQAAADAQAAAKAQANARQELDATQKAYKAAKLDSGTDLEKVSNDLVFARDGLREATTNPPKAPAVPSRTGAGYIDITPLRDALDDPAMKNATIDGLGTLANGTRGYIDALSNGTNRVSASEAESIRQAINDAYDIRGGSINSHVGRLKATLDQSMDAATDVPASYREGRAAYRAWAAKYEDPAGVANVIRRDAKGNFLNEDRWRTADNGLIGTTNEQAFQQITRRLLANRDTAALDRLKAEMVHRPYEAAAKGGGDQNNFAVFSPHKWRDTINSIGMNKYRALFGKDEVSHLGAIYQAAQALHEPVPGVVNSSNSGTTLINAAGLGDAAEAIKKGPVPTNKAKALALGLRASAHVAALPLHATGAGVGAHVAVEGVSKLAKNSAQKGADTAARKALAAAIQRTLSPAAARDAANENASRAMSASERKALARLLGRHSATAGPAAVSGKGNR